MLGQKHPRKQRTGAPGFTLQGGDEAGADPRDDIVDQPFLHAVARQPLQDGQEGLGDLKGPFFRTAARKQVMNIRHGAAVRRQTRKSCQKAAKEALTESSQESRDRKQSSKLQQKPTEKVLTEGRRGTPDR